MKKYVLKPAEPGGKNIESMSKLETYQLKETMYSSHITCDN